MSLYVPTRFVWRYGGDQVHLCGSFTRWVETVPMAGADGQSGMFSVVVHLPPGYHQYKFIVDGDWRHDEQQPYMPDPLGNVNNWIFVRRSDAGLSEGVQAQSSILPNNSSGKTNAGFQQVRVGGVSNSPVNQSQTQQEIVAVPVAVDQDEPAFTLRKIQDFLQSHTAYELIPESNKVVLIDIDFPVRQAFHALHEQGVASVPLWDGRKGRIAGMISPSDFINALLRLRNTMGDNPMSETEMDVLTIRMMREEAARDGQPNRELVYVKPEDTLAHVVEKMSKYKCHMAPVMSCDLRKGGICEVLHVATISHILACLMRHFMTSWTSLPFLSQLLGKVPIGTWNPGSPMAQDIQWKDSEMKDCRRIKNLVTVQQDTPITYALSCLLENGVSSLPVVDEEGRVIDIYTRADITLLARGNVYSRLRWEDVTVGEALSNAPSSTPSLQTTLQVQNVSEHKQVSAHEEKGKIIGGLTASLKRRISISREQQDTQEGQLTDRSSASIQDPTRVWCATRQDTLRTIIERLSMPLVRRIVVVEQETRKVEGLISLSDVASYLLHA